MSTGDGCIFFIDLTTPSSATTSPEPRRLTELHQRLLAAGLRSGTRRGLLELFEGLYGTSSSVLASMPLRDLIPASKVGGLVVCFTGRL